MKNIGSETILTGDSGVPQYNSHQPAAATPVADDIHFEMLPGEVYLPQDAAIVSNCEKERMQTILFLAMSGTYRIRRSRKN